MIDINKIIIGAIEEERIDRDLSIQSFARELGLNQQTLHRILNRQRGIGMRSLKTILTNRPQWLNLINGSVAPDDPNGDQPDRS